MYEGYLNAASILLGEASESEWSEFSGSSYRYSKAPLTKKQVKGRKKAKAGRKQNRKK